MSSIITQNNQTILDVAVQESGTVEALFDLMKLNGLSELPIHAQSELQLSPILRPEIVDYYKTRTKQMGLAPIEVVSAGALTLTGGIVTINAINSLNEVITSGVFTAGSGTQELPVDDIVYNVYVNGALNQSFTSPASTTTTINIS